MAQYEYKTQVVVNNETGAEQKVLVRSRALYAERCALVRSVVEAMFEDGSYRPYLKEHLFAMGLIDMYTKMKSPSGGKLVALLENTNFLDILENTIDKKQMTEMRGWLEEMIAYRKTRTELDGLLQRIINGLASEEGQAMLENVKGALGVLQTEGDATEQVKE